MNSGIKNFATSALTGTLAVGALTAVAVSGMTHEAPKIPGYVIGSGHSAVDRSGNQPTWTAAHAADFPDCVETLPAGQIASSVVVVRLSGEVTRMDVDAAWQRIENDNAADDIWVIGQCA